MSSSQPPSQDLLADLTFAQQEAVTHMEGPLLILAGAGSGKTRVITRRIAWLLQQGVRPGSILAITFTNKAAGEMRNRVEALVPGNRVWISTFHSLGARLLRQYADRLKLERNFTIYDQDDRNKIVKDALEASGIDSVRFSPERLGGAISKAKNQLLTPEKYAAGAADFFTQTVARVYAVYQRKLREANGMDFDDLLYMPALALRHDEELRSDLDARFKYILIDEYQDTNQAQYEIAQRLSIDHPNLCVVGDPDQSIYRWRGSDIRNILDFERDFPNARVLTLDKNYRSTKAILHAASGLIAHNKQRKKKGLVTDNAAGQPVQVLSFDTGLDEADSVVRRIREAVEQKRARYRDFAIFVRINALTRTIESAFVKHGVPFQIVKGLAFFERKENRDVLAYLRLLVNPQDNISFLRVVNEPPRGVGKVSLDHLQQYAQFHEVSLLSAAGVAEKITAIKGKPAAALKEFHKIVTGLRNTLEQPPDAVIREVLDRSGYRAMLKGGDEEEQERLANIEELITAAKQFSKENPESTIGDFLEQITLASDVDGWDEQQDCVSVMTLHAAKGLEFPVVYILAMEQGILPHERSLGKAEDVEEERRLAFVGMTRAMQELYVCHARLREFRGQALYAVPSMFLEELPEEVEQVDLSAHAGGSPALDMWRSSGTAARTAWEDTGVALRTASAGAAKAAVESAEGDYEVGQIVQHDNYGVGQVTDLSGFGALRKIKIRFPAHGEKTFIASKVQLRVVPKR
jgi:ATP-dependent DNA helicase UvrD/PcrA